MNPRIFPALVSTTVASSEATTLLRPLGACGSCSAACGGRGRRQRVGRGDHGARKSHQDAAIPPKNLLRSLEIGAERLVSLKDCNVAAFSLMTALRITHYTNYIVVRDTCAISGRSCPRLVQRVRIISKAFAASRSSGFSASALRSSSVPRSI